MSFPADTIALRGLLIGSYGSAKLKSKKRSWKRTRACPGRTDHLWINLVRMDSRTSQGIESWILDQEIISVAAECSTLPELIDKLKGKIKDQDLLALRNVFEYYAPIYHRLVYAPRLDTLKQQLAEFEKGTTDSKMIERLGAVKRFMKSPWSADIPLTIVLLPLPSGGHSTHGESLGAIQVVELLPGMKFRDHADVVFHEGCHALWGVKPDLDQVKKSFSSISGGKTAYAELNEGMATALGQGWFCKEAFGKSAKNWYMDKVIDGYAHALMPVLVDYLYEKRPIDGEFGRKATEAFNHRFGDLDNAIKYTRSFWVAVDSIDDKAKFKASVKKLLPRLNDLWLNESLASEDNIRSFKEVECEHRAILLAATRLDKLHDFGFSNEQIDLLRVNDRKPTTLKIGNSEVLVCIADTPTKQQDMLYTELSRKRWTPRGRD